MKEQSEVTVTRKLPRNKCKEKYAGLYEDNGKRYESMRTPRRLWDEKTPIVKRITLLLCSPDQELHRTQPGSTS